MNFERKFDTLVGRWPLFNQTFDQSHTHHELLSIVVGGTAGLLEGVVRALVMHQPIAQAFAFDFFLGVAAALVYYVGREIAARIEKGWRYRRWDGILDVFVPWQRVGILAAVALTTGVPWWAGALVYLCAWLVLGGYTIWRPANALLYDGQY